jgi:hypothetical protein
MRREFLKPMTVLTDVLNTPTKLIASVHRITCTEELNDMTTMLMEQLQTGDVIEIKSGDDVITVLVLLATDDALVLDPCDGATPFVLNTEELVEYRKFDAEALFADA